MADPTYQPFVYMKQGGDEQVVASGGAVTVESGGKVDFKAGSGWRLPVATETTGAAAKNFGISKYDMSTSATPTTANRFPLAAPEAGVLKTLYVDGWSSSGASVWVRGETTNIIFKGTTDNTNLFYKSANSGALTPGSVTLLGMDSTTYIVIAKTSGWTYT